MVEEMPEVMNRCNKQCRSKTNLRKVSFDANESNSCVVCSKVLWDVEDESVHTVELCNSAGTRH